MSKNWRYALQKTLHFEGDYVNDPRDPGGETRYGISKRSYPELDIFHLTRDVAETIYYRDFWSKGADRIIDQELAWKLFDVSVTSGPGRGARLLQEALCVLGEDVEIDGVIGPITLAAANTYHNQAALVAALKFLTAQHYVLCNQPHYLAGRLIRAMA